MVRGVEVALDAIGHERLGAALWWHQGHALRLGVADAARREAGAVERRVCRVRSVERPREQAQQLAAARPGQPGDAQDLARAQLEGGVADRAGLRQAWACSRTSPGFASHDGEDGLDGPPGHGRDDALHAGVAKLAFVDLATVAQDREAVGDVEDLFEPVGDVDDGDALGLEPLDGGEQPAVSASVRAAVGSSRMSTFDSCDSARASAVMVLPTGERPVGVLGHVDVLAEGREELACALVELAPSARPRSEMVWAGPAARSPRPTARRPSRAPGTA